MVFMPFCNTKPEEEWRCFKPKTCVPPAFAGSGTLGSTGTLSCHFQLHVGLQSTEGSTERVWQSYSWWAVFLQGSQPGPRTGKSCISILRDLSTQVDTWCHLRRTVTHGPIRLQFSGIHFLLAGKREQSMECRFNCEQVKLQNRKAKTTLAWGD